MIGLSLHLVLLMNLEDRPDATETERAPEPLRASIEVTERITERVSERTAVSRGAGSKTARFIERLRTTALDDPRKVVQVVAELNDGIELAAPNARKLVAQYRRGELS